jgi:hypothetical protein
MQSRIERFGVFERVFLSRPPPVERTIRKKVNIGDDAFFLCVE